MLVMLDPRLIGAEILKLRRRRGLMAATAVFTFGTVALYYAVVIALHVFDPLDRAAAGGVEGFDAAMSLLTMTAAIAGVLVGATAGGADIEAGVFRDLAATGRSRSALFAARVPGAWAIVVPAIAVAITFSAVLALALEGASPAPSASDVVQGAASALVAGMLLSAASAGLAALSGSRGMVIGGMLAFQLGVSPLLAQVGALGDARFAIPQVATARISGALSDELALGVAIVIVVAWAALTLGAGLWRTRRQEI